LSHNPATFVALRLGVAVVVGMLLGINRHLTNKPIGMRTLGLISLGAAVVSASTIHFGDWRSTGCLEGVVQGIIQGIMAGIGFHRRRGDPRSAS
jgi:putative Mg2+ transporter-C (MgtC) family protein